MFLNCLCGNTSLALDERISIIQPYRMTDYNAEINAYYRLHSGMEHVNLTQSILAASEYFLDRPYRLFPNGEGVTGRYDQNPLYRTDVFDCLTYANTVLALAKGHDLASFQRYYIALNYRDSQIDFTYRFHFMNVDWNHENEKAGYIKDITSLIHDRQQHPIALSADTLIDKAHWYQWLQNRIQLLQLPLDSSQLWHELHNRGKDMPIEISHLNYIPLNAFYDKRGKPIQAIFKQIPNGAIIEIATPNWDLRDKIGTKLDISHLGFAIQTPKGLMFRAASQDKGAVTDIPLSLYLRQQIDNPHITGITVLVAQANE